MDKIRKIAKWIWGNKERMILIVMVGVLVHRVYKLIDPDEVKGRTISAMPKTTFEGVPPDQLNTVRPQLPPPPPIIDIKQDYTGIHNRNPFWLHAKGSSSSRSGEITAADLGISALNIRTSQGRLTAQISTPSAKRRWYTQNERFEQFELIDIDETEQSITIYSTEHRKQFTYNIP